MKKLQKYKKYFIAIIVLLILIVGPAYILSGLSKGLEKFETVNWSDTIKNFCSKTYKQLIFDEKAVEGETETPVVPEEETPIIEDEPEQPAVNTEFFENLVLAQDENLYKLYVNNTDAGVDAMRDIVASNGLAETYISIGDRFWMLLATGDSFEAMTGIESSDFCLVLIETNSGMITPIYSSFDYTIQVDTDVTITFTEGWQNVETDGEVLYNGFSLSGKINFTIEETDYTNSWGGTDDLNSLLRCERYLDENTYALSDEWIISQENDGGIILNLAYLNMDGYLPIASTTYISIEFNDQIEDYCFVNVETTEVRSVDFELRTENIFAVGNGNIVDGDETDYAINKSYIAFASTESIRTLLITINCAKENENFYNLDIINANQNVSDFLYINDSKEAAAALKLALDTNNNASLQINLGTEYELMLVGRNELLSKGFLLGDNFFLAIHNLLNDTYLPIYSTFYGTVTYDDFSISFSEGWQNVDSSNKIVIGNIVFDQAAIDALGGEENFNTIFRCIIENQEV